VAGDVFMILNFWGTMVAYQQIVPGSLLDILVDRQVLDPVADANFFWPYFLDNRQWLVAVTTLFLFLPLSVCTICKGPLFVALLFLSRFRHVFARVAARWLSCGRLNSGVTVGAVGGLPRRYLRIRHRIDGLHDSHRHEKRLHQADRGGRRWRSPARVPR